MLQHFQQIMTQTHFFSTSSQIGNSTEFHLISGLFELTTACQRLSGARNPSKSFQHHLLKKVWDYIVWISLHRLCWLWSLLLWETWFGSYSFTPNPEFLVPHWQYNYLVIYWQQVPVIFPQKCSETDWKCDRLQWNQWIFLFEMMRKQKCVCVIICWNGCMSA
jgi:hypothetical protein